MFERYTEKARRVIFFARYEASQFGSPYIETEHILLGVFREDKALTMRFLHSHAPMEVIRREVEAHKGKHDPTPTSVDLPLSNQSKRVLAYAAEEAERLGHKRIGSEHLLLGLLREEKSFAAELLKQRGMDLVAARKDLEKEPHLVESRALGPGPRAAGAAPASISEFTCDLTQAATEGLLDPLIGREPELNALMEVLSRRDHRSALLIGERGAGKSVIIEGLAQRIADGNVVPTFADNRLRTLDAEVIVGWVSHGRGAEERFNLAIRALIEPENMILFIDGLEGFLGAAMNSGSAAANGVLKHWLCGGRLVCVGVHSL